MLLFSFFGAGKPACQREMLPMQYYLGIDGGGTKTAALILNEAGAECGRGTGGPGSLAVCDDAALRQALRDAVQSARQAANIAPDDLSFTAVCAGMAGYSLEARREAFADILRAEITAVSYAVVPDYRAAWQGATGGTPGLVVIAGTGAVTYGCNAEGREWREDGLGFLLGDRGSGFDLGLQALRHALESLRLSQRDALTETVLNYTHAALPNQLMQWLYDGFSPARVAGLAPHIGALADTGDPESRLLLAEMARRLRHAVRQVRHHLWLPREAPVYPLGGLWQISAFLRDEFAYPQWQGGESGQSVSGGRFVIGTPRHDAVFGAALLARKQTEGPHT